MQIIHSEKLIDALDKGLLFFDTNILIGMIEYPQIFSDLMNKLIPTKCSFLTIPQVRFEFTRGATTVEKYNDRIKFLDQFKFGIYPIDNHTNSFFELIPVLHKVSKGISYTDFLLCLCLCKFTSAYLVSEDRDIPANLFDRVYVITIDTDKDLRSYGVYRYSKEKMSVLIDSVI